MPDPIGIVRLLEWAFGTERADLSPDDAVTDYGHVSQTAAICAILERGALIQSSGRGENDTAADAVVVAAAVLRLGDWRSSLVAYHARLGQPPDWMPGAVPRLVPADRDADGEPVTAIVGWYIEPRSRTVPDEALMSRTFATAQRRSGYRDVPSLATPVAWRPSASEIAAKRRRYTAWADAVAEVGMALRRGHSLEAKELTGEVPMREPWRVGQA